MNASSLLLYTNDITPDLLCTLDKSPFTEQQLASFDEHALAIIERRQAYAIDHPAIAIYRMAAEGSQTRNGGVVKHATGPVEFKLENGQQARVAKKGDFVVYPDGNKAQIITGAGKGNSNVALVGSYLNNGDEIINTPQSIALIMARKGVPKSDDFLPTIEC